MSASSSSDPALYCDAVCTAGLATDQESNLCGQNIMVWGGVDYCYGSNSLNDAFLRTSGWDDVPSGAQAVATDLSLITSQIKLDSIVVVYRAQGISELRLNAGEFGNASVSIDVEIIATGSWSSVTFDLSAMPCTQSGFSIPTFRFMPFGNDISTGISIPTSSWTDILQLQNGIQVATDYPSEVLIHDISGRMIFRKSNWNGTNFIPMDRGVYVVRAGNTVKKVVFQ